MIYCEPLTERMRLYGALDYEPLRITVQLDAALIRYDPVNFDNVLAAAVIRQAVGDSLPDSTEPYFIPIPLKMLWCQPGTGLPLWASTILEPQGAMERMTAHTHRRPLNTAFVPDMRGKPFNPNPKLGRYKETRIPHPGYVSEYWQADVIGHRESITELLKTTTHIGKRRSEGYGFVREWRISSIPRFQIVDADRRLRRPVPVEYLQETGLMPEGRDGVIARRMGWTVPYWTGVPEIRALCIPDGVCVI